MEFCRPLFPLEGGGARRATRRLYCFISSSAQKKKASAGSFCFGYFAYLLSSFLDIKKKIINIIVHTWLRVTVDDKRHVL